MGGPGGPDADLTVVVLAAGRSSRMGFPKALVDLQGEPALGRILRLAREAGIGGVRVVLGHHEAALRAVLPPDTPVVVNPAPDRGQTSSLRCGLEGVGGAVCLWPVDHAALAPATLARLLEAWRGRAAGVAIVVPSDGRRRGHPALLDARVAAELRALPDGTPAHAVVRREPGRVQHVLVTDPAAFRDMDRPEDREALT